MMKKLNTIEVGEKVSKKVAVTITYKKDEIILRDNGIYTTVHITAGFPLGKPGQPSLPWRRFYVSVPLGAVVSEAIVENLQVTLLAEEVIVDPIQPTVLIRPGTLLEWVPPDAELYASSTVWPEVFVQLKGIRYTGSFALAEIEVCPFRYHPPSKRLELVESLNLLLQYRDAETTVEKPYSLVALKHERKFAERVRAMVLNPEDVSRYQQFKEGEILKFPSPPQALPEVDYVIITSSALSKSFEKLATWRHRLGLRARVVRVEDIKSGSVPDTQAEDGKNAIFWHTSGYHDGGTRDEAEMIRNFIQWANVNWSTDYVLLGGDTEVIPCRQAMQSTEDPYHPWTGFNMFKYFTKVDDLDFQFQTNLAKNAKASASSEKPNHSPANVTDEKPNTSWQCDASDGNPWITVELFDTHTPVNCVKMNWVNPPASYTIAVSDDQSHWTDVYSTSSTSGTEEAKFSCVSTFYVRIRITGSSSFSLQEVKIYGPPVKSDLGSAYQFTNTDTRVYLGTDLQQGTDLQGNYPKTVMQPPDLNESLEDNLKNFKSYVIIMNGAKAGMFIPYDENASATQLGWRFIDDLLSSPATVSTTPTRFIEICGPAEYHGNPFAVLSDGHWVNYTPTDLYYADVASGQYPLTDRHAWDADGNRVYGERYGNEIDKVNGIADVSVGRIPVNTANEVDAFIEKVIHYEKFTDKDDFLLPMEFAVSVLLGSANWERTDDPNHLDPSAVDSKTIRDALLDYAKKNGMEYAHPPRWLITRCYEDSANVNDPPVIHASHDTMIAAIKSNHNAVSLMSHGNYDRLCFIFSDDIKTIENTPGIFFACACNTAMFDVPGNEALGEWALRNPKGGAVAYIGETRMSPASGNHGIAFWKSLPTSERLGEMFQTSQGVTDETEIIRYLYNLLGDPAMRVWSDRPRQLTVSHPEEICMGYQLFEMTVTSNGQPVQDAFCCVTMGETIFATFTTDASGKGSCFITSTTEGIMHVAVSGKNLIPYLGSTIVKLCDGSEIHPPGGFKIEISIFFKVLAWAWMIFIGALLITPKYIFCIKCGVLIDAPGYIGDGAVATLGIGAIVLGALACIIHE